MKPIIDGFIADTEIKGDFKVFATFGELKWAYSVSYLDAMPKIYLTNLPPFDDVYSYFMSCHSFLLKMNERQDICLSLFYNPYFEEFYNRFKNDVQNIPNNRLRFLKRYLLLELSDDNKYGGVIEKDMRDRDYFIEHDIYNKCKEMLSLIKKR